MTRVNPVQQRSMNRLESLRSAAREVIAEVGRDRFTTQMVAERSGASIGTVYRYYPDRVAILDDLYPRRDAASEAAVKALDILNDSAISNPRERVRQAREVLESAVDA